MGKNVEFELDSDGVRSMLTSKECQDLCKDYGDAVYGAIPASLNNDEKTGAPLYITEEKVYKARACFKVLCNMESKSVNAHAQASNAKHNTLLKALNSVKGG